MGLTELVVTVSDRRRLILSENLIRLMGRMSDRVIA
jgi:hypothetical protein